MKSRSTRPKAESKQLKNPRRRAECDASLSRKLKHGKEEPPADRGACEPETAVQGSE